MGLGFRVARTNSTREVRNSPPPGLGLRILDPNARPTPLDLSIYICINNII